MNKISTIKLILLTLFLVLVNISEGQEISNLYFEQEGKDIVIYYSLDGEEQQSYFVKVYCSEDGGDTWSSSLKYASGDVGENIRAGRGKKIVWNVLRERETLVGDIKFKITAENALFGIITDERDGNKYKWRRIGNQVWMVENLNYRMKRGSWCYADQKSYCDEYGRLYDWQTAQDACPEGWQLPSEQEWKELEEYLGGRKEAGGKLKERSQFHWMGPNKGASNKSGFKALPGGFRFPNGMYNGMRGNASFWSSTEMNSKLAYRMYLDHESADSDLNYYSKSSGFSVRCVKDK